MSFINQVKAVLSLIQKEDLSQTRMAVPFPEGFDALNKSVVCAVLDFSVQQQRGAYCRVMDEGNKGIFLKGKEAIEPLDFQLLAEDAQKFFDSMSRNWVRLKEENEELLIWELYRENVEAALKRGHAVYSKEFPRAPEMSFPGIALIEAFQKAGRKLSSAASNFEAKAQIEIEAEEGAEIISVEIPASLLLTGEGAEDMMETLVEMNAPLSPMDPAWKNCAPGVN